MAKRRNQVGSVCKSKKEGEPAYIKMRDGKTYRLENVAYQTKSLEDAVRLGKLTEDIAEKVRERINKVPPWVLFEIVEYVEPEPTKA